MKKIKRSRNKGRLRITNDNLYSKRYDGVKLGYMDLTIMCELESAKQVQELINTLTIIKHGFEIPDTYVDFKELEDYKNEK